VNLRQRFVVVPILTPVARGALAVSVDEYDVTALLSEGGAKVYGCGGFSTTALLTSDKYDHGGSPSYQTVFKGYLSGTYWAP